MQILDYAHARLMLVATLLVLYAAMGGILLFSKISLEPGQAFAAYATLGFPLLLAAYARWRGMHRLTAFFDTFIACLLATVPLTVLSYFGMSFNQPLADSWLVSLDAALGFDWHATVALVDRSPLLASVLNLAYRSFAYQLLCLPLWYSITGRQTTAAALIFAFIVFCIALSLCAIAFPALGAFAYLELRPEDFANIDTYYGYFFLEEFHAVREQAEFNLRLHEAAGILTFPSGHAGAALLLGWIGYQSRVLRVPLVILNVAMGFSAITNGGHYLADVLAGLALAGVTIALTTLIFFRAPRAEGRRWVRLVAS